MAIAPVLRSIISPEYLAEFVISKYRVTKNTTCSLFRTGMNHTYFVSDNETKYVLRVYSHK